MSSGLAEIRKLVRSVVLRLAASPSFRGCNCNRYGSDCQGLPPAIAKLVLLSDVSKTSDSVTNRSLTDSLHSTCSRAAEGYVIRLLSLCQVGSASFLQTRLSVLLHPTPPFPEATGRILADRPYRVKRSGHHFSPFGKTGAMLWSGTASPAPMCISTMGRGGVRFLHAHVHITVDIIHQTPATA